MFVPKHITVPGLPHIFFNYRNSLNKVFMGNNIKRLPEKLKNLKKLSFFSMVFLYERDFNSRFDLIYLIYRYGYGFFGKS